MKVINEYLKKNDTFIIAIFKSKLFCGKKDYTPLIILLIPLFVLSTLLKHKGLIIPSMELIITEKCNLNCLNCTSLMPYYINPQNKSNEELIKDISSFLDSIDFVFQIKLLGGEPFLNRDFAKLIDYLCNEKKYKNKFEIIRITTNGTVKPSEKVIKSMRKNKSRIMVDVSNYGNINKKIIKTLEKNKISYVIPTNIDWISIGKIEKQNRNLNLLKDIYSICELNKWCNVLLDGKYFLCEPQAHGTKLGLIQKDNNYVDIRNNTSLTIKNKIKSLRKDTSYICACDYCNFPLKKVIKKKHDLHQSEFKK
jgi:organic radical activating enzyme